MASNTNVDDKDNSQADISLNSLTPSVYKLKNYGFYPIHSLKFLKENDGDFDMALKRLYKLYFDNDEVKNTPSEANNTQFTETNKKGMKGSFAIEENKWVYKSDDRSNRKLEFIFFEDDICPLIFVLDPNDADKDRLCKSKTLYQAVKHNWDRKGNAFAIITKVLQIEAKLKYNKNFDYPEVDCFNTNEYFTIMDEIFVLEFEKSQLDPGYINQQTKRQKMPIYYRKNEILKLIDDNPVVLIKGPIECEKSSQIPQYILDDWLGNYNKNKGRVNIICTSFGCCSAYDIAEKVAEERCFKLDDNNVVHYSEQISATEVFDVRLLYCSLDLLLRRLLLDQKLNKFVGVTHVIVNDIHDRREEVNFLLLVLKRLLTERTDIKVILITEATLTNNTDVFVKYFGNIPAIEIRTPKVEMYIDELPVKYDPSDIESNLINILKWVTFGEHDFDCTGTIAIIAGGGFKEKIFASDSRYLNEDNFEIIVFEKILQLCIEDPTLIRKLKNRKLNQRRIFLVSIFDQFNAESLVLKDCSVIINSGWCDLRCNWYENANSIIVEEIGRVTKTVCICIQKRKISSRRLQDISIAKTKQMSLNQTILRIRLMQTFDNETINDVLADYIDPPTETELKTTLEYLKSQQILTESTKLTTFGNHLAELLVDVPIGKLILYGVMFSCLDSMLTIAACCLDQSPFKRVAKIKHQIKAKKLTFYENSGDIISDLMAYNKYMDLVRENNYSQGFAAENLLNLLSKLRSMQYIKIEFLNILNKLNFVNISDFRKLSKTYTDTLVRIRDPSDADVIREVSGVKCKRNNDNLKLIIALTTSAFYPNFATNLINESDFINHKLEIRREKQAFITLENLKSDTESSTSYSYIHPSSTLFTDTSENLYVTYKSKQESNKSPKQYYLVDCVKTSPIPLLLFTNCKADRINKTTFRIDDFISCVLPDENIANECEKLRIDLAVCLEKKISDPKVDLFVEDREVIERAIEVLTMNI